MNGLEQVKAFLSTADEQVLDAVETAVRLVRARRLGLATEEAVSQEVDRLLSVRDARRVEARRQWDEHVIRTLKQRLSRFEEGRLGMCSCRDCLSGYVTLDVERMCHEGTWQFWQEANGWKPWVL